MKKVVSILTLIVLIATIALVAVACNNVPKGYAQVEFVYTGDNNIMAEYKNLIEEYNSTQGNTDKIRVTYSFVAENGQDGKYSNVLASKNGPDVVVISDEYFKKQGNYLTDMKGLVDDSILNNLYESQASRFRYNVSTGTNNADDPQLGLPLYNSATVMYYNRSALEAAGVKVISVEESDLAAFNSGAPDKNGKTKAQYGLDGITVPAKGFYRSTFNFTPGEGEYNGKGWRKPASGEILIFNDCIACNWDEIEDVGLIMTKTRNSSSQTNYGYYTEWWFNYGWSVGGNCAIDVTGNGDYYYGLPDTTPNYIVADGKTYTGLYSGTVYNAGDTLELYDIIDAKQGDAISCETDQSTYMAWTVNGQRAAVRADMAEKVNAGVLVELPSTQTAFRRFCSLAGKGGLNVCPSPATFNATSSLQYFTSQKLAFLVETSVQMQYVESDANFDWGIAPLPVYKTYTNPEDPNCDTVEKQGKVAAHSLGYSICIRKGSQVTEQAAKFVSWMMTEGQKKLAAKGFASAAKSDREDMIANMQSSTGLKNAFVMADSLANAKAGDWWYMTDRSWIANWSEPLNKQVRYGTLAFNDFIYAYVNATNAALASYKNALSK